jgi:inosine triphosphate pyrophosphatase
MEDTKLTVIYVTGNKNKLLEVQALLGPSFNIIPHSLDIPELQGEPFEIIQEKLRLAVKLLHQDGVLGKFTSSTQRTLIMTEDTCLCFNALNGLPGPYIKWFVQKLGLDGINKMLQGFEDKSAYSSCIFALCDSEDHEGKDIKVFEGKTLGKIVPPQGPDTFGWDSIFLPDGFDETFAQMNKQLKNTISHRFHASQKVKSYLEDLDI